MTLMSDILASACSALVRQPKQLQPVTYSHCYDRQTRFVWVVLLVGEMGASVAWRQPQKVRVLRVYERRLLVL